MDVSDLKEILGKVQKQLKTRMLTLKAAMSYIQSLQPILNHRQIDLELAIIRQSGAWDALKYIAIKADDNNQRIIEAAYFFDAKNLTKENFVMLMVICDTHGMIGNNSLFIENIHRAYNSVQAKIADKYSDPNAKPLLMVYSEGLELKAPVSEDNYIVLTITDVAKVNGVDLQNLYDGE